MRCLANNEIERYVTGAMEAVVAGEVTKHLLSCNTCRKTVALARNQAHSTKARAGDEAGTRALFKLNCDQCGARYGIPTDRVRGRVLKIRCKKCSNLIRVQADQMDETPEPQTLPEPPPRAQPDKVWFLVIRRERVGPFTQLEVRDKFQQGEVRARTYAWRQGYDQWERLSKIPEFYDLAESRPGAAAQDFGGPTRRIPAGRDDDTAEEQLAATFPPGAAPAPLQRVAAVDDSEEGIQTMYRTPGDDGVDSAVQTAYLPADESSESQQQTAYRVPEQPADDHSQLTQPRSDGGQTAIHFKEADPLMGLAETGEEHQEVTAEEAAQRKAEQDEAEEERRARAELFLPEPTESQPRSPRVEQGEWDQHMKGQRREESVLFSLKHLHNLADNSNKAKVETMTSGLERESSGLFDIRPMVGAAVAQPLVMPAVEPERRRIGLGVVFLVGLLGILVGAGALIAGLMLLRPQMMAALIQAEPSAGAPAPAASKAPAPAPAPVTKPASAPTPAADAMAVASAPSAAADAGAADPAPDMQPLKEALPAAAKPSAAPITKAETRVAHRKPGAARARAGRKPRRRPRSGARPRAAAPRASKPRSKSANDAIDVVDPDMQMDPDLDGAGKAAAPARAPAARAPARAAAKPKPRGKGGKDDELDALIAGAMGDKRPAARPRRAAPAAPVARLPKKLNREQVSGGMRKAFGAVRGCRKRLGTVGVVMVRATIDGGSGRISRAAVAGPFAGTPTAQCVLSAVYARCTFPRFSGPAVTVKYPFVLR